MDDARGERGERGRMRCCGVDWVGRYSTEMLGQAQLRQGSISSSGFIGNFPGSEPNSGLLSPYVIVVAKAADLFT